MNKIEILDKSGTVKTQCAGADTAGSVWVGEINATSGISERMEQKSIQRALKS